MTVLAEGPSTARLMLVGESPGDEEIRQGRPFVGPAGRVLDGMLEEAGIQRSACYLTNLYDAQPNPDGKTAELRNDFAMLYEDKARKIPSARLQVSIARLWQEIETVHPHVLGALGAEPLRWLTETQGRAITDWRGSVLEGAHRYKVIPTYHPAAVSYMWKWRPVSILDYRKMWTESTSPALQRKSRRVITPTTVTDACQVIAECATHAQVAFDIEVEAQQVQSIGLAYQAAEAYVIPFWWGQHGSFWSTEDEMRIWGALERLFATTPMLGHNVSYDLTFLRAYQITCHQLYMDTMVAFHILYPEFPKGLDFLVSIYTDYPFYKWMRNTDNPVTFWEYNGLDAMLTWECAQAIERELKEN